MVVDIDLSDAEVDRIFHALAATVRRDILTRTLNDAPTVSELAGAYDISFAAIQKHVAVLEEAGLVTKQINGRERLVRANPETIGRARQLLKRYEDLWRSRITQLDQILQEP